MIHTRPKISLQLGQWVEERKRAVPNLITLVQKHTIDWAVGRRVHGGVSDPLVMIRALFQDDAPIMTLGMKRAVLNFSLIYRIVRV